MSMMLAAEHPALARPHFVFWWSLDSAAGVIAASKGGAPHLFSAEEQPDTLAHEIACYPQGWSALSEWLEICAKSEVGLLLVACLQR
jgi:hypothetical protein